MGDFHWASYNELAWVDFVLDRPDSASEEVETYCRVMEENASMPVNSLLHLGCGAGMFDYTFKKHFEVTGVDVSPGMLKEARGLNPEVTYHEGDMRSIELNEAFDSVAIPDSIGYMTTTRDLQKTLHTARRHLKPGGVLLITASTKEEFQENNFAYSGSRGDVDVTVFENNYIPDPDGDTYEATLVYLIRRKGHLQIVTDRHTCGIFSLAAWRRLLEESGFRVKEKRMDHLYDGYLLQAGEYPLTLLVCTVRDRPGQC